MRRFLIAFIEAAFALACIYVVQNAVAPIGMKPEVLDFRVVYCAERAAIAGADPYRTEPLRSCEHRVDPVPDDATWAVTPYPLPGYDAAAFSALARLPFAAAKSAWIALLVLSFVLTVAAIATIARVRASLVAAVFAPTMGFLDFFYGEPVNISIAAIALAALAIEIRRPRLAAAFAVLAMIEPHVGLPAVTALFFFAPVARLRLIAGGAILVALSIVAIGPATSLEYFTTFLPLQAHSEVYAADQYSLTRVLFVFGCPIAFALKLGLLSYLFAIGVGLVAARRAASREFPRALLVLIPVATAMLGGSFVHDVELVAALPAALVLSRYAVSARIALGLLAFPWSTTWRGLFVVIAAAAAAVGGLATPGAALPRRFACIVAVAAVAFGLNKGLLLNLNRVAPKSQHVSGAPPVAIADATPASIPWEWSIRLTPSETDPSLRIVASKLPDWIALAIIPLSLLEATTGLLPKNSRRRRAIALSALVAFACCTNLAHARTDLTAATIETKVAAAKGERPAMERITAKITQGGLSGTEVRIRSGDDYRIDTTLGPLRRAEGMVGGVLWKQNANGQTVVDASAPLEPTTESVVTSVTHPHRPFERYVVSTVDSLGNGTREVVDPSTWRVVETDRVTSTETTTTRYSAFTTALGYVRPWKQSSSDGFAENDGSSTIVSDVASDVTKAMLAIPQSRGTLVEFPKGRTMVDLPARLTPHHDRFIVRVNVGTRGLDFLLDTGTGGISIDRDVAQSLGLRELDTFSNADSAGRYVGGHVIEPELAVGDVKLHDVVLTTIPHVGADSSGVRVVGLLGFDFLAGVKAKIDYAHGRVTVFNPHTFNVPIGAKTIALDVRLADYVPETALTINGQTGTRFIIDTAGIGAALVVDYYYREHRNTVVDAAGYPQPRSLVGIGGTFDVSLMQIARINLGSAQFDDLNAFVVDSPKIYGGDFDGIIGPDILRQFTVFLDYGRRRVYLDARA